MNVWKLRVTRAVVVVLMALATCLAQGAAPAFDVVSIHAVKAIRVPGAATLKIDPTRLSVAAISVNWLIVQAYGVQQYQLSGGPDWLVRDRFAIEATTSAPASRDQMMLMLRQALADRFHLKLDIGVRSQPVYSLEVAPGGLHLTALGPGDTPKPPQPGELVVTSISELMTMLNGMASGGALDRQVIDNTGLVGAYDIHLLLGRGTAAGEGVVELGLTGQLKKYLPRLGLTLTPAVEKIQTIRIVSVSRPTEN